MLSTASGSLLAAKSGVMTACHGPLTRSGDMVTSTFNTSLVDKHLCHFVSAAHTLMPLLGFHATSNQPSTRRAGMQRGMQRRVVPRQARGQRGRRRVGDQAGGGRQAGDRQRLHLN